MNSREVKRRTKSILWYTGAVLISLATVYPFLWMVSTSFKPEAEIYSNSLSLLSSKFTLANYAKVFRTMPFARYFMNSFILAASGVATNLFFGALAGYGFAKLKFQGRKVSFLILLSSMMIPAVATMIPQFLVLKFFPLVGGNNLFGQGGNGFINSYFAIIIPGAVGAFAVFFMKQFFETLPDELAEAARVDGCGEFKIFTKITVPMLRNTTRFLIITSLIGGLQMFEEPKLLFSGWASLGNGQTGGPGHTALTTVWKFFNDAFSQDSRLGYGSAMAYTLFVIIMLFSVVGFRLSRGKDGKGE